MTKENKKRLQSIDFGSIDGKSTAANSNLMERRQRRRQNYLNSENPISLNVDSRLGTHEMPKNTKLKGFAETKHQY